MTSNELHPFDEPHTLEEAQLLVAEARRLRARAEEIHDQALGAAIRLALRDGRRMTDVPDVLNLTYAQTRRYLGRDDQKLLPINYSAAADLFLRYLLEIDRGDISWNRADQLYIQPTPAVHRVAALAARDGRTFPWSVRDVGRGLLTLGVVQGEGSKSSVSRTRNGQKVKVWAIELIALEDLDLVWSPFFGDPTARSFRAIDYKFDEIDRKEAAAAAAASAKRHPKPNPANEFLQAVREAGASEFGVIRGDRVLMHPPTALQRVAEAAETLGRSFPYSTTEVADGLHAMGALHVDRENKRAVGRRIDGRLVRVWDVDLSLLQ